jgi:hypothetical protein
MRHVTFLQSGAGCRDEPDIAAPHDIGEAQRHAVDDGRSAVRSHDEEAPIPRERLDRPLVGDRNVVGEHHHVEPLRKRLQRLGRRVIAGHRDEG